MTQNDLSNEQVTFLKKSPIFPFKPLNIFYNPQNVTISVNSLDELINKLDDGWGMFKTFFFGTLEPKFVEISGLLKKANILVKNWKQGEKELFIRNLDDIIVHLYGLIQEKKSSQNRQKRNAQSIKILLITLTNEQNIIERKRLIDQINKAISNLVLMRDAQNLLKNTGFMIYELMQTQLKKSIDEGELFKISSNTEEDNLNLIYDYLIHFGISRPERLRSQSNSLEPPHLEPSFNNVKDNVFDNSDDSVLHRVIRTGQTQSEPIPEPNPEPNPEHNPKPDLESGIEPEAEKEVEDTLEQNTLKQGEKRPREFDNVDNGMGFIIGDLHGERPTKTPNLGTDRDTIETTIETKIEDQTSTKQIESTKTTTSINPTKVTTLILSQHRSFFYNPFDGAHEIIFDSSKVDIDRKGKIEEILENYNILDQNLKKVVYARIKDTANLIFQFLKRLDSNMPTLYLIKRDAMPTFGRVTPKFVGKTLDNKISFYTSGKSTSFFYQNLPICVGKICVQRKKNLGKIFDGFPPTRECVYNVEIKGEVQGRSAYTCTYLRSVYPCTLNIESMNQCPTEYTYSRVVIFDQFSNLRLKFMCDMHKCSYVKRVPGSSDELLTTLNFDRNKFVEVFDDPLNDLKMYASDIFDFKGREIVIAVIASISIILGYCVTKRWFKRYVVNRNRNINVRRVQNHRNIFSRIFHRNRNNSDRRGRNRHRRSPHRTEESLLASEAFQLQLRQVRLS